VFVMGLLPQVGIGQWLSTFADRYPRRSLMLIADAARAAVFLALGLSAAWLPAPAVLLLLFAAACCTEPFNSARSAAILDLVPPESYESAVWIDSLTQDVTQALGFAGGGLAVALVAPGPGLLIDAGTFVGSFLLVLGVPGGPVSGPGPTGGAAATVLAAARQLLREPVARTLIAVAVVSESVATATDAAVVPFVTNLGPGHAWLTGVVLAAAAVGTLLLTAALVREVDAAKAFRLIRLLVTVPLVAIPLLLVPYWWAQAGGLVFAAALSVPLVPAAMVVNPMLPAGLRATCRSVIVGGLVLTQAAAVTAVGVGAHYLGPARTVAVAFGVGTVGCLLLLGRH
jgi:hypothetical protein